MATIEHQMTEIYVFVDDYLKAHRELSAWRHSNNAEPDFTDAEVITVAVLQACFATDTLKKTHARVAEDSPSAFPRLPCYAQWIRRLHALSPVLDHLIVAASGAFGQLALSIVDSDPIPVCKPIRHGVVRLLREDGAWWGRSTKGWFFGFKLHAIIDLDSRILMAALLPANLPDRDAAHILASWLDGGIGLGDLSYSGAAFQDELAQQTDLLMLTRKDAPEKRMLLGGIRARIESVFAQLWTKFSDRIRARSWLGLWNALKLKLLHHNLVTTGRVAA
jgi:hypothetical protein